MLSIRRFVSSMKMTSDTCSKLSRYVSSRFRSSSSAFSRSAIFFSGLERRFLSGIFFFMAASREIRSRMMIAYLKLFSGRGKSKILTKRNSVRGKRRSAPARVPGLIFALQHLYPLMNLEKCVTLPAIIMESAARCRENGRPWPRASRAKTGEP